MRRLRSRYVWKGMTNDIAGYIRTCHECQLARASLGSPAMVQESETCHMGQAWHVDLCGPFEVPPRPTPGAAKATTTKPRSFYVLVAVEAFSRWTELVVVPDKTPTSVTFAVYQAILCRHGLPERITTDRGGEFYTLFDDMCYDLHIEHRRTATRHPQSNGLAERAVQKVKRTLLALAEQQPSAWPRLLPKVQFTLNTNLHSSTGYTPYELVYGRPHAVPPDVARFRASGGPRAHNGFRIWCARRGNLRG